MTIVMPLLLLFVIGILLLLYVLKCGFYDPMSRRLTLGVVSDLKQRNVGSTTHHQATSKHTTGRKMGRRVGQIFKAHPLRMLSQNEVASPSLKSVVSLFYIICPTLLPIFLPVVCLLVAWRWVVEPTFLCFKFL